MDSQLRALNVVDMAILSAISTGVTTLANATPALTAGKVSGKTVRRAYISVETGNLRWTSDGTTPTAATGHVIAKDDSISFTGANYRNLLGKMKFIGAGSTIPVHITYFD